MIAWADIETAVLSYVSTILGPDVPVRWYGQSAGSGWSAGTYAELNIVSMDSLGRDECRQVCEGDDLRIYYVGNRTLTVQVKLDSMFADFSRGSLCLADTLLGKMNACCASNQVLDDACISISDTGRVVTSTYCDCNGRKRNASMFNVVFNTTSLIDCGTIPSILKAEVSGTVLSLDGTVVATSGPTVVSKP